MRNGAIRQLLITRPEDEEGGVWGLMAKVCPSSCQRARIITLALQIYAFLRAPLFSPDLVPLKFVENGDGVIFIINQTISTRDRCVIIEPLAWRISLLLRWSWFDWYEESGIRVTCFKGGKFLASSFLRRIKFEELACNDLKKQQQV